MRDELLRKIHKILTDGIVQEKDLVYLLVEIRKLMGRPPKYQDPIIKSFSNWVVHTELTQRHEGTTEILQEFDTLVTMCVEGTSSKKIPRHFNFDRLQSQLKKLLAYFNLPTDLTDDNDQWVKFLFLYASVVGDCPITFTASTLRPKYLKELELRGCPEKSDLEWKLTLHDGRILQRHRGRVLASIEPATAIAPATVATISFNQISIRQSVTKTVTQSCPLVTKSRSQTELKLLKLKWRRRELI